jgi:serine/threonine-protein kinase
VTSDAQLTTCPQCGRSFPRSVKLCPNDGAVLEHGDGVRAQIGDVLDGKYKLDAFLSQGGMGAVYKATHVMLGRTVAVKLINPEFVTSTEAVRRFQREARAATSLNHPNIVSVFDLGQTPQGTLYIAMEFVEGPSLKSVITKGGPLEPMRIIPLLRQVASALGAAHRHGIVHRDLKPQNIMIARSADGHESAKLVDFGIAKTFDDATQLTTSGSTMGTPQYMSPEQAAGQTVDGRSDLYSLGIVMYEMLSGDVPFNDKSLTAIIIKHMNEAPQPPSLKNPAARIPEALEATVLRCLEKDPANRFQTAEEFTAALQGAAHLIHGVAAMPAGQDAVLEHQATIPAVQGTIPLGPARAGTSSSSAAPLAAPSTVRLSSDTRATAARPASSPPAPTPVAARPTSASNNGAVAVLIAAIVFALGGAMYYVVRGGSPAPASVSTETPAATPAGATGQPAPAVPAGAASAVPASALPQSETAVPRPPQPRGDASAAGAPASDARPDSAKLRDAERPNESPIRTGTSAAGVGSRDGSRASPAASAPIASAPAQATQAPQFPQSPAVYFRCSGPSEICSALRTAVDEALDSAGLSAVRQPPRADIEVAATVEGVQETVSRQFQTTFAVRTYSIDVIGETTRTGEAVPMPPPSNLSFDPQFGAARVQERARLVAADIVDRVKAFAARKRGG